MLNAYGDAMTSVRDESARTYIREFSALTDDDLQQVLDELTEVVAETLSGQGVPADQQVVTYQVDLRYHGQGFEIPIDVDTSTFDGAGGGLTALRAAFDAEHERLFSFLLGNEHEVVNVRASASGPRPTIAGTSLADGGPDPSPALRSTSRIWVEGESHEASVYDRELLLAGNVVPGPAIVAEMDSTTLVLPGHSATVHPGGSLLIRPTEG